jgi:hypothetical protein
MISMGTLVGMKKLFLILMVLLFSGCGNKEESPAVTESSGPPSREEYPVHETRFVSSGADAEGEHGTDFDSLPLEPALNLGISLGSGFSSDLGRGGADPGPAYTPLRVQPKVPDYRILPGLANVENRGQFKDLTGEQIAFIEKNGFVVRPSDKDQLFWIYEGNDYEDIPLFVSADSALQLYHIFYDFSLREVERDSLYPKARQLNEGMIAALVQMKKEITDPVLTKQLDLCIGYFGTAQLAFGVNLPDIFPAELREGVEKEYDLIIGAEGLSPSALYGDELYTIYGPQLDYSQFKPRGHYTRSAELVRYFRGIMWYGLVPNQFFTIKGERLPGAAIRTMLTTIALGRLPPENGKALWESIYWTTSFFVGNADDGIPLDFAPIVQKIFGSRPDLKTIPSRINAFFEELENLPPPRIIPSHWPPQFAKQFQFMGQRYLPDTEILQRLTDYDFRPIPTALDVFAVFGSTRAADIIRGYEFTAFNSARPSNAYPLNKGPSYPAFFSALKKQYEEFPESGWRSNMYYGWLWTQRALIGSYGQGYPLFMRNSAWEDKSLAAALGSYAELKHDTILYGKQNTAELGGGGDPPPILHSYVEPNAELYNRLLWLTRYSRQNLEARNILPAKIKSAAERIETLLQFLLDCSLKELNGRDLSIEEKERLRYYGGWLESLSASIILGGGGSWYNIESETDKDMALIADCGTGPDGTDYLEEAVGRAAEIFVVTPGAGKLWLTRGAVFDYYEFISGTRLSDEEWQALLKGTSKPARPRWTETFFRP